MAMMMVDLTAPNSGPPPGGLVDVLLVVTTVTVVIVEHLQIVKLLHQLEMLLARKNPLLQFGPINLLARTTEVLDMASKVPLMTTTVQNEVPLTEVVKALVQSLSQIVFRTKTVLVLEGQT